MTWEILFCCSAVSESDVGDQLVLLSSLAQLQNLDSYPSVSTCNDTQYKNLFRCFSRARLPSYFLSVLSLQVYSFSAHDLKIEFILMWSPSRGFSAFSALDSTASLVSLSVNRHCCRLRLSAATDINDQLSSCASGVHLMSMLSPPIYRAPSWSPRRPSSSPGSTATTEHYERWLTRTLPSSSSALVMMIIIILIKVFVVRAYEVHDVTRLSSTGAFLSTSARSVPL